MEEEQEAVDMPNVGGLIMGGVWRVIHGLIFAGVIILLMSPMVVMHVTGTTPRSLAVSASEKVRDAWAAGVGLVAASHTPAPTATPVSAAGGDPERQFYRGAYDVCMLINRGVPNDIETCNTFVGKIRDKDWYGQESPGFDYGD